jgi:hypothetical protein
MYAHHKKLMIPPPKKKPNKQEKKNPLNAISDAQFWFTVKISKT